MPEEFLILVDKDDKPIGKEEKVKCHLPKGLLHRAFTALIFDKEGKLVLTKRAGEKMLWPGDWDGTVASHPRETETYVSSGERRMPEELGINCNLDYLFKFEYHVPYKDIGSENEICGTLIGIVENPSLCKKIEGEIDEVRLITPDELLVELSSNPEIYCPWMIIALKLLDQSEPKMLKKYENILTPWLSQDLKDIFQKTIKIHLPDDNWRLVK